MEAIKVVAGVGSPLKGKLMVCDFSDMSFATIDISRRMNCPSCHGELAESLPKEKLVWLCGLDTANINPEKPLKLDLKKVYETVRQQFKVNVKSSLVIVFDYKDTQISLFSNGRMLIKNVDNEKAALKAYREILQRLNLNS